MRAVTFVDGEVRVAVVDDPEPGVGEVLVRVRAAGLNAADLLQRHGLYPAPRGAPADVPGLELAGEVVAVGPGATRFAPGDLVMAVVGGGGQAELAVVHERAAMPVPGNLDWPQAGGVPEVFTTAHDALFTQCGLGPGERVCVHGAAGGRIVVIGVGAGGSAEVNLLALMAKRARISGSTLRARPLEGKADAARRVERHVLPLLASGRVRVPVEAAFPLDDAAAAYDRFAAGGKLGKLVLLP